jgi:hypothetical protein
MSASLLIPKHKSDSETVQLVIKAGYPEVEPVLYELLEWLQDMNWPIAWELYPFLSTIGIPLAPSIRRVFQTDDYTWQRNVSRLFSDSKELYELFREQIIRIAKSPTSEEKLDDVDEVCLEAIHAHEPTLCFN